MGGTTGESKGVELKAENVFPLVLALTAEEYELIGRVAELCQTSREWVAKHSVVLACKEMLSQRAKR